MGGDGSVDDATLEPIESSNFLTLDCSALAEALSTLPLHQRLDIDVELLLEEEGEGGTASQNNRDSLQLTSSNTATHESVRTRDVKSGCGTDRLDLSQSLKRIVEKDNTSSKNNIDFSSLQTLTQASSATKQLLSSSTGSKCSATTTDEELDKLLSKSDLKPSLNPNCKVTSTQQQQEASSTYTSTTIATTSPTEDESSELDDMLDELLA